MLSISPQHASIVDAPATATSIFALPGWPYVERPPEGIKDSRALRAEHVADGDAGATAPHQAKIKRFSHTPTITYRRGDEVTVVTGPVVPAVPHMTDATRAGWEKWFGDVEAATIVAKKAAAERRDRIKTYFEQRENKKAADWEAKCTRAQAAGKPMPKKPVRKDPPPDFLNYIKDSELVEAVNGSRNNSEVARRLRKFTHRGTAPIGGRVYDDFEERFKREDGSRAPAIRSWLKIIGLQLFNSALPKNVLFGRDKEIEYSASAEGMQRLFALDQSHVILDKSRRCCFIVDLDGWWVSIDALRSHLRKLLPPHLMPIIITYRGRDEDGLGVENPHLAWPLPPGSRVLRGAGQKKLAEQFKLFEMVQDGIVSHLIPVGADPGHTNKFKTKNPLTAAYSVECCDDYFPTMSDWRDFLPTITPNKREMQNRAKVYRAAQHGGVKVEASQAVFNDGVSYRKLEIKAAMRRKDPAYLSAIKSTRAFADWLYNPDAGVMTKRLIKMHGDTKAVRSVLASQRDLVEQIDAPPSAVGEFANRGRDRFRNQMDLPALGPNATAQDREYHQLACQAEGGRRSRLNLKAVHCGLIAEEIESRIYSGLEVVKSEVVNALINAGTVSRSTAYDHFDHVLKTVRDSARYQEHLLASRSESSSHPVKAVVVAVSEPVPGVQPSSNPANTPFETPAVGRNPAKPLEFDPAVPSESEVAKWRKAYLERNSWRHAVKKWRASQQCQPAVDGDLVDDPLFQAVILCQSAWSNRRH